ncbi:unnamed protein product [Meloidogyne enterolobii]|uniref:Uncharacterized protein n=1 Tax=Meloidogyne enterolobii TaxID=390850 RepID=A0ACB1B1J8_MELEN
MLGFLNSTQQQLRTAMQNIAQLKEENKHMRFMNSIKKFDEDLPELADKEREQAEQQRPASDAHNSTLQELGFGDEEQDLQNTSGQYSMPTPANAMAASATAGYDIPQRLKTLHNLVITYAAQGRYEVAVPLCKQHWKIWIFKDVQHSGSRLPVSATLNNLAVLHGKRGKYKDAEPLCKRALEIREKVLGADHPDVAKQLNNLALIYQNQVEIFSLLSCFPSIIV